MNNGLFGFPGPLVALIGAGIDVKTSGSGAWIVPNGVTEWWEVVGGGGGGGTAGGDSTTRYDSTTVTGGGGTTGTTGGTATNGDVNIDGFPGQNSQAIVDAHYFECAQGGDGPLGLGTGGKYFDAYNGFYPGGNVSASGYCSGRSRCGGGAVAIKRRTRKIGQDSVAYQVGAAGTNAGGGIIIFIYRTPTHTA